MRSTRSQVLSPSKLFLVAGGKGADKKLVWKLSYKTDSPPKRKEWVEGGAVRKELEAHLARRQYVGWLVIDRERGWGVANHTHTF